MRRRVLASVAALVCATPAFAAPPASSSAPQLIERTKLFGNPSRSQGGISPDGKWLSWLAPRDGVMNIWVAPVSDPGKARPLTAEKTRPIRAYFWAPDSSQLLFINDKGGDENFLLYGVDVASGAQKTLTPFEKTRAQVVAVSRQAPDRILVGLNNRDARWHDVHSLDLKTGALTEVFRNDGFANFLVDDKLVIRGAFKPRADGGLDLYSVQDGKASASPVDQIPFEDSLTTQALGYSADGGTLYWLDSRGRDTSALVAQDVKTGARSVLGEDARADVQGAMADPRTRRIDAYAVNYMKTDWRAVDPAIRPDLAFLAGKLKGEFTVTGRTNADDLWTVAVDTVTAPAAYYLYDRKAKSLTKLFTTRPELESATLAPMHPVEIRTRDGLTEVSYLTLPPGSDANGDGRPDKPVPMVLLVHGGPWGRDAYGYNGLHQWLANRGYAVLSPNFRASTGFGKRYTRAGDREWGRKMHDDLLDAVDWAVKAGVAPADKVAIMGGSYGGYATLAGLTFTPDRFACGVDIVGPSNLNTLLATIPPYWQAIRTQFNHSIGDPSTPEGQALLKERSPLWSADRIRRPLLIGQGANDPRVNKAESEQIVAALKAKNIPVTYVLFPDEGHGFARPENNLAFYAISEQFLDKCLGGRAEPYGQAFAGSSITVPYGADYAPGLTAALAGK